MLQLKFLALFPFLSKILVLSISEFYWTESFHLLHEYVGFTTFYQRGGYSSGSPEFLNSLHEEHVAVLQCGVEMDNLDFPEPYIFAARISFASEIELSLLWDEKVSETCIVSFQNKRLTFENLQQIFLHFAADDINSDFKHQLEKIGAAATEVITLLDNELQILCEYSVKEDDVMRIMEEFDARSLLLAISLVEDVASIIRSYIAKYLRPYVFLSLQRVIELGHTCLCLESTSLQCANVRDSTQSSPALSVTPLETIYVISLLDPKPFYPRKYSLIHREETFSFSHPTSVVVVHVVEVQPGLPTEKSAASIHLNGNLVMFL